MNECGCCELIPSSDVLMKIIKAQTRIMKSGHDLALVMSEVVHTTMELTGSDGATIEFAEGDDMVYRAGGGTLEPFLGFKVSRHGSLSGLCVQNGQILYSEDAQNDPRVDRKAAQKVGAASMVVVPLKFADQNVGILKVISSKKHSFDNNSVCILSIMAEMLGAAMYYAGQYSFDDLLKRATTDAMTGVENRASFYEKLRILLSKPKEIGLIMVDMDGLKMINDHYGHRAGDEAIKELASRLKCCSRDGDIVARLGGDEFGVILSSNTSKQTVEILIDRFREIMSRPFDFEGESLSFGASIGFALCPSDTEELTTLIDLADQRMYSDKQTRKIGR